MSLIVTQPLRDMGVRAGKCSLDDGDMSSLDDDGDDDDGVDGDIGRRVLLSTVHPTGVHPVLLSAARPTSPASDQTKRGGSVGCKTRPPQHCNKTHLLLLQ